MSYGNDINAVVLLASWFVLKIIEIKLFVVDLLPLEVKKFCVPAYYAQ